MSKMSCVQTLTDLIHDNTYQRYKKQNVEFDFNLDRSSNSDDPRLCFSNPCIAEIITKHVETVRYLRCDFWPFELSVIVRLGLRHDHMIRIT